MQWQYDERLTQSGDKSGDLKVIYEECWLVSFNPRQHRGNELGEV